MLKVKCVQSGDGLSRTMDDERWRLSCDMIQKGWPGQGTGPGASKGIAINVSVEPSWCCVKKGWLYYVTFSIFQGYLDGFWEGEQKRRRKPEKTNYAAPWVDHWLYLIVEDENNFQRMLGQPCVYEGQLSAPITREAKRLIISSSPYAHLLSRLA
jgi:hypothetical protein